MKGDRERQLARVSPTGPHPAIMIWVAIFCMGNVRLNFVMVYIDMALNMH
jgi:hypothetical protein